MKPLTNWEKRVNDDQRAKSIYAKRRDIDAYHEQRRLERQIKEPVS